MKRVLLLAIAAFLLSSCSKAEETVKSESPNPAVTEQAKVTAPVEANESNLKVLFFMNPNGRPCQIQDANIRNGQAALDGVNVEYLKTTNKNDLDLFYKYGIRGLPSLIITDTSGKELKRMVPGIRTVDEIAAAVASVK